MRGPAGGITRCTGVIILNHSLFKINIHLSTNLTNTHIGKHTHTFIHSFIQFGYFYSFSSKSTTTQRRFRLQHRYCIGVNTPERYGQLWVKFLPMDSKWGLEWDLNLRPSGRKTPNSPLCHHAPRTHTHTYHTKSILVILNSNHPELKSNKLSTSYDGSRVIQPKGKE